jgi:acetate kinase
MKEFLPDVPQAAIFDTAFHQTMPNYAYTYAIPFSLYKKYGLRRYGFHGTSHSYVSKKGCEFLGVNIDKQKIITCHLGNGASITAIKNGKSVDTSMGLTPVEGTMMGTRSGDLDLGVLTYIIEKEELNVAAANTLINKHSGLLGLSGVSSDMREVEQAAEDGNERAKLALDVYFYRILKYIGSYTAVMGGVDMIIFTGGIGENSSLTRQRICKRLEFLNLDFDYAKNETIRGELAELTTEKSKIKVLVVPTNEELVIAQESLKLLKK